MQPMMSVSAAYVGLNPLDLERGLLIEDVDLWTAQGVRYHVDVHVEGGRVMSIFPTGQNTVASVERISGRGLALMPAGVDVQTHLRVPGQSHKELPHTGLWAAVKGGYGAVLTMPNTIPVIDNVSTLAWAQSLVSPAEQDTGVRVFFSGALTQEQNGKLLSDVEGLAAQGVVAFTDDGKGVEADPVMAEGFRRMEPLGLPFLQHAEVPGHGGVLAPSAPQRSLGVRAYPAEAEVDMVHRDIRLLEGYPQCRYHVLHVSARGTLPLIREARRRGLHVTGEASPHHLFFSGEDITPEQTAFKMNPPLRSPQDREALIEALANGTLSFLATDHAPHEAPSKALGFDKAPFGTTGLETALRCLLTLWQRGRLSAERVVQVFSYEPARFLGLGSEFGSIAPGQMFRAVLVDPRAAPQPVRETDLASRSKNNCFLGHALGGRVVTTFLGPRAFRAG